jgi:hypothetical protein
MATRSSKRKKEGAGGPAAVDPPAELCIEQAVEQPVEQPVEQAVEQTSDPEAAAIPEAVAVPEAAAIQREELEAGVKQREKALRSELDEEKQKVERLRGSWCIFLLDAEQLVALQGELEEAMQRVKRQQQRRACESTLCEKIPDAVCPIARKIMLNPVIAADGHTYERPAIERLIALHKGETKSPVTGLLLAHHDLEINWAMRGLIFKAVDAELERTQSVGFRV